MNDMTMTPEREITEAIRAAYDACWKAQVICGKHGGNMRLSNWRREWEACRDAVQHLDSIL